VIKPKVLFILKKNETYGFETYTRRSSGLWNSTSFIIRALQARHVDARICEVLDNNFIDRHVTEMRPDIVVIEALWVVPEKFDVLKKLHPRVKWFVHLHSHIPFLAIEGIAMNWIQEYAKRGVKMIANSKESYEALQPIVDREHLSFLPNVYIREQHSVKRNLVHEREINVGCFGAIRPLKNTLIQALAALQFAKEKGLFLRFHINGTRTETGGDPVLKNLRQLFQGLPPDTGLLEEHHWMEPDHFLFQLRKKLDIGLQVSLTETFNVVGADYVSAGLPTVFSKEVAWAGRFSKAADNSVPDIVSKMHRAMNTRCLVGWNQRFLLNFSAKAQDMWFEFVHKNVHPKV
jgi:hypothetical protein